MTLSVCVLDNNRFGNFQSYKTFRHLKLLQDLALEYFNYMEVIPIFRVSARMDDAVHVEVEVIELNLIRVRLRSIDRRTDAIDFWRLIIEKENVTSIFYIFSYW